MSPTLAWLHIVCMFACLDQPLTVNFNECIQIFHKDWLSMVMCTSAKPWEWEWRVIVRLYHRRETERKQRQLELNAFAAHTATSWIQCCESDGRVTRQACTVARSHGLSVKLSPCPCSQTHSSSCSGRTNGCIVSMCGHLHLLAQARLRNDVTLVSIGNKGTKGRPRGPAALRKPTKC